MKPKIATLANWLVKHEFIVILCLAMVFLRIPNIFEPYWYGDEGVYLTVGQAMRRGEGLYTQIADNKPPMIYWVAMMVKNLAGLKLTLLVASIVSLLLFYQLALIMLRKKEAVWLATGLFMLATTLPTLEGNVVNGELLFLPWLLAGIWVWWKFRRPFLAGGLMGLATLTKIPVLFDGLALILGWLFFSRRQIKPVIGFVLGVLAIVGLSFAYFGLKGSLSDYIHQGFLNNFSYIQTWDSPYKTLGLGFLTSLIGRIGLLCLGLGWLWTKRKLLTQQEIFLVAWLWCDLFASLLSLRPYPHYFIQILPAACLIAGKLLTVSWPKRWYLGWPLIGAWVVFKVFHFNPYPTLAYYHNFLVYLAGTRDQTEYYQVFDRSVAGTYTLAKWLALRTTPTEKVFIWGDEPLIYALANRPLVGRYSAAYQIESVKAYEETIAALDREKPKYILDTRQKPEQFPLFYQLIQQKYALFETLDRAKIYRKMGK